LGLETACIRLDTPPRSGSLAARHLPRSARLRIPWRWLAACGQFRYDRRDNLLSYVPQPK
jgi:hypothetical protein